ncbi:DNA-binding transcriptional regulator, MarR family [Maridesulfovibrio ferrireducens]|uniref:HTH-type transcriptional regulator SarZ n=1 Tax=Maridesulfovibrio ferrireducens TaxID=246191 RepID=A0A1G9G3A4_9BACT|nr:MarR family winged helix-turn-helix transcriptional regulator [Maridesulfovibrio ferrireducens]SDK95144.1 DNA-binding transcriptional regulator, MarR family [Maridesulfovibrio ferrireducens]
MSTSNQMVMELLRLGTYLQREGARISREFELTQQQFVILVVIKNQGPISQKEILSDLLYEKSNVSKSITRLTSLGMVKTSKEKKDSRVVMCEVTDKGRDVVKKCMKTMKTWNEKWLEQISDTDLKQMVKTLSSIGAMK